MSEPVKNVAASIMARLKNQTEIMERPFAETLQYYAMERFLYRLSRTSYADKFVLKGGLMFYVWDLPLRRPTRDIDFSGYVSNNRETLLKIIHKVIAEPVPEDGIRFDPRSVSVEETQIDADYQGIQIKLTALLERSRIPVQIDIGFSDVLASKAESIEYPNLLSNIKAVRMKGYPREAVVAEKFHAMVRHAEVNSRMKDYYDLWLLLETFEFEGLALQKAMEVTFRKRETQIPRERPPSLSPEFAHASQNSWNHFLHKMDLQNEQAADFQSVIEKIWSFLEYPIQTSLAKAKSNLNWFPQRGWK
jgi:predicted nucleotidyltransferase component of viral defense system